jgi:hypothetical protein
MPKSKVHKKKLHREFLPLQEKYVRHNDIKYFSLAMRDMVEHTDLTRAELEFLLYVYDLEFFEITWAAKTYNQSRKKLYERIILSLKKKGYLTEYYNHKNNEDAQRFQLSRTASKLSVSHKGRHAVQRLYRKMYGEEDIKYV